MFSTYMICLKKNNKKYYIDATNINEALGIFFKNNPTICYDDILDHMEI